jgi:hypothetical protein
MPIGDGWRSGDIGWDGRSCVRSRVSSHRTRFCGGIGSVSRGSGRPRTSALAATVSSRFAAWSCGWRKRIPRGATRGSKGPHECRASRRLLNDCSNTQGARPAAGAGAPDVVADVSPRALGRGGRGGFFHHGSLDVARIGDVPHRVRDRPRITARPDRWVHAATRRSVHATGESHADCGGRVMSHNWIDGRRRTACGP